MTNNFNEFNEGGSHGSNPIGGIPQGIGSNGKPNLVEQGETSVNSNGSKYIFSNKIKTDLIKEFNLPNYIKGKSFSDASKSINDKFKDRNDNSSLNTKKELLNRLTKAQEYIKMQAAFKNNSSEVPDMMNGQSPEGINEFEKGGFAKFLGNNKSDLMNLGATAATGDGEALVTGGLEMGANALLPGSGAFIKPLVGLGKELFGIGKNKELRENNDETQGFRNNMLNTFELGGQIDPNDSRIPEYAQGDERFKGVPYKSNRYNRLLGDIKKKQNSSIPISNNLSYLYKSANPLTLHNNKTASSVGTIKDIISRSGSNIASTNNFEDGGYQEKPVKPVKPLAKVDNYDFLKSTTKLEGQYVNINDNETSSENNNTIDTIKDMGSKLLRFAPAAMNLSQLSKLKKPQYESLNKLDNKYKKHYADENALTNQVNEQYSGTAEKLANASGGSGSSLRANLLGSQLNKSKALSDAYLKTNSINRQQNDLAQKFNLNVNSANLQQSNLENDINAKNKGAYETNKSKLKSELGNNLGAIGKEGLQMKQVAKMFGYTWDGKYLRDKKGKIIDVNKKD